MFFVQKCNKIVCLPGYLSAGVLCSDKKLPGKPGEFDF